MRRREAEMDAGKANLDWTVRSFVYGHIVEHGRPPTAEATAVGLGLPLEEARAA
jgi:hypothetical protein